MQLCQFLIFILRSSCPPLPFTRSSSPPPIHSVPSNRPRGRWLCSAGLTWAPARALLPSGGGGGSFILLRIRLKHGQVERPSRLAAPSAAALEVQRALPALPRRTLGYGKKRKNKAGRNKVVKRVGGRVGGLLISNGRQ